MRKLQLVFNEIPGFWLLDFMSAGHFLRQSSTVSGISSDILSGILSAISSKIHCGRGPAGTTLILGLLFGFDGGHSGRWGPPFIVITFYYYYFFIYNYFILFQ